MPESKSSLQRDVPIVFRVRDLPIEAFGNEHGRQTRKFVLLTIATHADPYGARCYPGVGTIARECGLGQRGARKVITWLRNHGFLQVEYKASGLQTNTFTVVIPQAERNSSVPQEFQCSSGTESIEVGNSSVPGGEERRCGGQDLQRSSNLPITYPSPTKRPTRARKGSATEFIPPEWVPSREWGDFVAMRTDIRKPLTDRACELAVKELEKLRDAGDSPADVLNQSVMNSWQGLFPLRRNGSGKYTASRHVGLDAINHSAGLEKQGDGTFRF